MAFCQHCGSQLTEGAGFCTSCGAPVENANRNPRPTPDYSSYPQPTPGYNSYSQPNSDYNSYSQPNSGYSGYSQPNSGYSGYNQPVTPIATGGLMAWSIVTLLLCTIPGIVAIVKTGRINSAATQAEQQARENSARTWCLIGTILGVLCVIANLIANFG